MSNEYPPPPGGQDPNQPGQNPEWGQGQPGQNPQWGQGQPGQNQPGQGQPGQNQPGQGQPPGQAPQWGQDPQWGQNPPPNYPQQPMGYGGQPPKTSPFAITSLVLGILGVFPCCSLLIFGIGGIVFGILAKKEIAESNGAKTGAKLAQWGFILGVIGVVLGVLVWILNLSGVIDSTFEYNEM